jgi:hypothetical protein
MNRVLAAAGASIRSAACPDGPLSIPLTIFAHALLATLGPSAWHTPSRCPYCPAGTPVHWIGWGRYQRYAGDPQEPSRRVAIARCRCKIVRRTFALPPDSLLPYCGVRTGVVLAWLHALFVERIGLNTLARQMGAGRGALRSLKSRFLRTLPKLRLPPHEGALAPATFLECLAGMEPVAVAALFRNWKECQPKRSIVGIYSRG